MVAKLQPRVCVLPRFVRSVEPGRGRAPTLKSAKHTARQALAAAPERLRGVRIAVPADVDDDCTTLQSREVGDARRNQGADGATVPAGFDAGKIGQMALAVRAVVSAGGGWIPVSAGGACGDLFPGRAERVGAGTCLVHVEAVQARCNVVEVHGENRALVRGGDADRAG